MNIERFLNERDAQWNALEALLREADESHERLGRDRTERLLTLYREVCSDLNRLRSHTANPEILDRLNQLAGRAYRLIYGSGGEKEVRQSLRRLLMSEIPATFRRERSVVASTALAFALGILLGLCAVLYNPANGGRLIPGSFFTESPRQRVEKIENGDERIDSVEKAAYFGAQLYTHNIEVAFLAFSLGALTIAGAYLIVFYNGVILGAVAAMYYLDGVGTFFFAWVGPHGALELPAIVFGAAAGVRFGRALLTPGNLSRAESVRRSFEVVWRMLVATSMILVCAGLIEGSFSQFSSRSFPYGLKISVALLLFLALLIYLFAPRNVKGEEP